MVEKEGILVYDNDNGQTEEKHKSAGQIETFQGRPPWFIDLIIR